MATVAGRFVEGDRARESDAVIDPVKLVCGDADDSDARLQRPELLHQCRPTFVHELADHDHVHMDTLE